MIIAALRNQDASRKGIAMVLFALTLPCMVGLVAIIADGGIVMSKHRRLQNTADSVAMSVANRLIRNTSLTACLTVGEQVRLANYPGSQQLAWNNGVVNSINNPPLSGPFAGNKQFVEVYVSAPNMSLFSNLFSSSGNSRITVRAVAGMESHVTGEGVIALDPCKRPGIDISGGAKLNVTGAVICNSGGGGDDQCNSQIDLGIQKYGTSVANNCSFKAELALVRGGVDNVNNFQNCTPGASNPLYANVRSIFPDPYRTLPVPNRTNCSGISNWTTRKKASCSTGDTVTLSPGVYEDIQITGSAKVTFTPGTYILCPKNSNQGLRINGTPTVTGTNVLFYATGSNYLTTQPGYNDERDGDLDGILNPANNQNCSSSSTFSSSSDDSLKYATIDININAGKIDLCGVTDTNSPFNNMLFYQRRRNVSNVQIQSSPGCDVHMKGSIYAKWANCKIAGGGRFESQFTVGTMNVTGGGELIVNNYNRNFNMAASVYLVE